MNVVQNTNKNIDVFKKYIYTYNSYSTCSTVPVVVWYNFDRTHFPHNKGFLLDAVTQFL
jgi:hypothetical protein